MATSSGSAEFDGLRSELAKDAALRTEVERALQINVDRVNPSDPGNRFVAGAAVEWIIAAAAWEVGVLTIPGGHATRGFDLLDLEKRAKGLWSVKSQSSKRASPFRISNGLGGSGKGLVCPTIFLSPFLPGLVFVDPEPHSDVAALVRVKKDATTLAHGIVKKHAMAHPECVAPLHVPKNEGRGEETVFIEYARTILVPAHFPRLSGLFKSSAPPAVSVAAELRALAEMREAGTLSDSEYDRAKNRALGS